MAEKEHPKAEKRYAKKAEKKPESKAEEKSEKKPDTAAEEKGEGEKPAAHKPDMHAEMVKRHLKEARDLHGQHRDAMRDMHSRHIAEMKTMSGDMGPANGDQDQLGEQVQQPGEGQAEAE